MNTKGIDMNEFSFKLGFSQVKRKDAKEVRERIMEALGLTTRASWYARLNGGVEPKVSEARAIEEVFTKYGITKVWGS
jgi:hypothetical protein bfra3_11596|nr:MAG TPA: hypothetical protein [Caudoviricetes sp.]